MKDFIRIIGISLILSGTFLYFSPPKNEDIDLQKENEALRVEIHTLESDLEKTSVELAQLQSIVQELHDENDENVEEDNEQLSVENKDAEQAIHFLLQIEAGTTSKEVSTILENAQIIENATLFNNFLKDENLTKNIQIGTYTLNNSMTIEEIAELITTNQ